jgi:hypothetical protein
MTYKREKTARHLRDDQLGRMLKIAAVALVACVAVAALAWFRPWEGVRVQEPVEEDHVWVKYTASFELLSTEDNGPIENIRVYWPYPYVRPDVWKVIPGHDPANMVFLDPPRENITISPVLGERTEDRGHILFEPIYKCWAFGRADNFLALRSAPVGEPPFSMSKYHTSGLGMRVPQGKIYPGDGIRVEAWFRVPVENIRRLTLANLFWRYYERDNQWIRENYYLEGKYMGEFLIINPGCWIPFDILASVEIKRLNGELHTIERWTGEATVSLAKFINLYRNRPR